MKHIKKVKPETKPAATGKADAKPEARQQIRHARPCIPVDGG